MPLTTRRGFVGALAALAAGWRVLLGRAPTRPAVDENAGAWYGAGDPRSAACVINVGGYLLGYCVAFNHVAQMADVDLAAPVEGERPTLVLCDDRYATRRLYFDGALDVDWDGSRPSPNKGFLYWTGSGWINDRSEKVLDGPIVAQVDTVVAAEDVEAGARLRVRNGTATRAS